MVKIENRNEFQIGDQVWWFDAWGNLQRGRIYGIEDEYAKIEQGRNGGAKTGAKLDECWPTRQDCLDAEMKRSELQKAEYKEQIQTVEDLVRFLLDHDVHSEHRNFEAEAVARERAKELLDLDV